MIYLRNSRLFYKGMYEEESEETILDRLRLLPQVVTVDAETVSTSDQTVIGYALGLSEVEAYYCPVFPVPATGEWQKFFADVVADSSVRQCYHNGNFDLEALRTFAIQNNYEEPNIDDFEDTSIMARVSGFDAGLEQLGVKLFKFVHLFSIPDLLNEARETLGKKVVNMLDVPMERVALKCLNDVTTTYTAYNYFQVVMEYLPGIRESYDVDVECLSYLKHVQQEGLGLDKPVLKRHDELLKGHINRLKELCDFEYGMNPGSWQQVAIVLGMNGVVLPMNRKRTAPTANKEALMGVRHSIAGLVLAYRGMAKTHSTYVVPWLDSDRAYTHFRLDLSTGRLGSYDRNLQNIPPQMREVFEPDTGIYSWADMSQVELRVFAYMTKDPIMMEAYQKGYDVHGITQQALWPGSDPKDDNFRRKAKIFNFAMIYYGTSDTLAKRTGLPYQVADEMRLRWLALYHVGAAWMDKMFEGRYEYVEDIFGRRMKIKTDDEIYAEMAELIAAGKEVKSFQSYQNHVRRTQVNYPIQASAASLNKRGLNMCKEWGMPTRLQVHDEIVWDGE